MISMEKKKIFTSITGVGKINVEMLLCGKDWWLNEIEEFITKSDEKFYAISRIHQELNSAEKFETILQNFINHIQTGGEEQKANLIRNHFRNWVAIYIKNNINGKSSTNGGDSAKRGTSTDRMEAASKW